MTELLFGHDDQIAGWVAQRIPHMHGKPFVDFSAIGVTHAGGLIAGVVYNELYPEYRTLQLSMAAESPKWARRGIIKALLHYPFEQLEINKLWTATPHTNERAIRFNLGIGFKREAVLRHHFGPKSHSVICSMLKSEYRRRYAE